MIANQLDFDKIPYLYDQVGRIYVTETKVYRLIEDEIAIKNYRDLLSSTSLKDLFTLGLIKTKIDENLSTPELLVLEHDKISFILHPCEYTNQMFWNAAMMFIKLNLELIKLGFVTHDSHPWNITYIGSRPVFYDFGSIIKRDTVSKSWLEEFFKTWIVPIWLANISKRTYKFSKLYRQEHGSGFGIQLFKFHRLRKLLFSKFWKTSNYLNSPVKLYNEILNWLEIHKPLDVSPKKWSDYYKEHNIDYKDPKNLKQQFVYDTLSKHQPNKVLDLASNKGYYSNMAAHLGADVIAFDYEEEIVNSLLLNNQFNIKITPALLDFNKPTPGLGVSFFWEDSFNRFKSDIVFALGLIHHICITQRVPVYLFCETCKKYATKGIVLEFVDPTDKHVSAWNKAIPKDYSIDTISLYFKNKFPNCKYSKVEKSDGLNRIYLYYY